MPKETANELLRSTIHARTPLARLERCNPLPGTGGRKPGICFCSMRGEMSELDEKLNLKRLLEIAEEFEEMARGYAEKGAQLHRQAAQFRALAALAPQQSEPDNG